MISISVVAHVHSEWSYDAKWPLSRIASAFAQRGHRAVLMTEHDRGFTVEKFAEYRRACADNSSDELVLIPGIEYSDDSNRIHVLTWGEIPFLGENRPTEDVLHAVRYHEGLAVLAHPSRQDAYRLYSPDWSALLSGIEVWNRKTDGVAPSKQALSLVRDSGLRAFVGIDFHTHRQLFPLSLRVDVDNDVEENAILKSLISGAFESRALGLPLEACTGSVGQRLLDGAERLRRPAAAMARRVIDQTRSSKL